MNSSWKRLFDCGGKQTRTRENFCIREVVAFHNFRSNFYILYLKPYLAFQHCCANCWQTIRSNESQRDDFATAEWGLYLLFGCIKNSTLRRQCPLLRIAKVNVLQICLQNFSCNYQIVFFDPEENMCI